MASVNNDVFVTRFVKLDYSETYRDNGNLDDTLNSQIEALQKVHFRETKEKEDEIEAAKRDADKIQSLKDLVNQRDSNKAISDILAKVSDSEDFNGFVSSESSRLQRRLQKEREKYSAKNHFNVILPKWNPLSDVSDKNQFKTVSVPVLKASTTTNPSNNKWQLRFKSYMQMTSSSRHRLTRPRSVPVTTMSSSRPYMNGSVRAQSATRSRRELAELSRIELSLSRPRILTPYEQRQNILHDLRVHQKELQTRVTAFVKELDKFNNRHKKNRFANYLET